MWTCRHCGEESEDDFVACWNCLYARAGESPDPRPAAMERPPTSSTFSRTAIEDHATRTPAHLSANRESSGRPAKSPYKVVPFVGHIRQGIFSSQNARDVSEQLQELINQHAADGWEFLSIDKVNIVVSPGCIGSLLGARSGVIAFDQIVFRRKQ